MINRRNLLGTMVASAVGVAAAPTITLAGGTELSSSDAGAEVGAGAARGNIPWRNWSGSQTCYPDARKAPGTIAELQALISSATGCVRPVGAGHSFTPLVPTDDTIVSLSRMSGVVSHDAGRMQAVIKGGTRLGDIGGPLAQLGQAMINMPDIDEQTLAGALGTATHGTGATLGCLPDFVEGLQLVTANGELLNCDRDHNREVFEAARVNLGALGVVTEVRMQNMAEYRLKREVDILPLQDMLDSAEDFASNNRNFEMYYVPFSGLGVRDIQNITQEAPSAVEKVDQNDLMETLMQVRDWTSWSSRVRELVLASGFKDLPKEVSVANSWKSYPTERNVRFNEMEYHLPREYAPQAFREVITLVEKHFTEVFIPFEFRYVKGDDIWLSPFHGRESCSIAIHRYFKEDYQPVFQAVEQIFKKYHGRPHWGKLHTMTGPELAGQYEHWQDFKTLRQQLDPNGKFLNKHLRNLFEIT